MNTAPTLVRLAGILVLPLLSCTGCNMLGYSRDPVKLPEDITKSIQEIHTSVRNQRDVYDSMQKMQDQADKLRKEQEAAREVVSRQVRSSAAATDDALRAMTGDLIELKHAFTNVTWPPLELKMQAAQRFNQNVTSLVGAPEPRDRIDVSPYYSADSRERSIAWTLYNQKASEAAEANTRAAQLQTKISEIDGELNVKRGELKTLNDQLAKASADLKAEQTKLFWRRAWEWTKASLGIGGIVALCFFFPAVIPLFGALVSKIVQVFPALMPYFQVASKSTLENVVKGVGNAKKEIDQTGVPGPEVAADVEVAAAPPMAMAGNATGGKARFSGNDTVAGARVVTRAPRRANTREILKRQLAVATDTADKHVIDHLIRKHGLE